MSVTTHASAGQTLFELVSKDDIVQLDHFCATSPKLSALLVKHTDVTGTSLLQVAATFNSLQVVRYILNLGADVNQVNNYNWSALMLAAFYGHSDVVKHLLIIPSINVDLSNSYGITALMMAVQQSHLDVAYLLLKAGANVSCTITNAASVGMTALLFAVASGDKNMVSILLSNQAEVNTQVRLNGWTPLMYAAACPDTDQAVLVARMLLNKGADCAVRNRISDTCADIALSLGHEDFIECLSFHNKEDSSYQEGSTVKLTLRDVAKASRHPIFDAIATKNRPLLLSLLTMAPICILSLDVASGFNPLICATCANDRTAVATLLQYKAPIDARNAVCGWTALMYAVYCRNLSIVKLLLACGADPTVHGEIDDGATGKIRSTNRATISVRDLANMNGYSEILQLLDVSINDREESAALPRLMTKSQTAWRKLAFWKHPSRNNADISGDGSSQWRPGTANSIAPSEFSMKSRGTIFKKRKQQTWQQSSSAPIRSNFVCSEPSFDRPHVSESRHSYCPDSTRFSRRLSSSSVSNSYQSGIEHTGFTNSSQEDSSVSSNMYTQFVPSISAIPSDEENSDLSALIKTMSLRESALNVKLQQTRRDLMQV